MILVSMRDDDTFELVGILKHICVVRKNKINAGMIVIGKHQSCIIKNHVALTLKGGHVLADGIKTA